MREPALTVTNESLQRSSGTTATRTGLPDVLSGQRRELNDPKAGRISFYVDGPGPSDQGTDGKEQPPLLLVHSVNAAPSAHEIKPLFDWFKTKRRTYAIDLPGFGHSDRSERTYRQRLMVDAVHAMLAHIHTENGNQAIDALAVSLSCEFLAKAALEAPESLRSLALVSPTGFAQKSPNHGPPEADCGRPGVYRVLSFPPLGRPLFRLLTSAPSVRFFLKKTWGGKEIDEEMFRNSLRMARYPGAHRAPFHFVSGFLFSADILPVFEALEQPVWLSHGVTSEFSDFSRATGVADKDNWQITTFQAGAMPYFELTEEFIETYEVFLDQFSAGRFPVLAP